MAQWLYKRADVGSQCSLLFMQQPRGKWVLDSRALSIWWTQCFLVQPWQRGWSLLALHFLTCTMNIATSLARAWPTVGVPVGAAGS